MNYYKIYNILIEYFKNTTLRERLLKRSKNDKRLESDIIYGEIHHIIPRALFGSDDNDNLVKLLPEEHLFIHWFRYKIFNTKTDLLATRFMLNGYKNNNLKFIRSGQYINKRIKKYYSMVRTESAAFRIKHGW